MSPSQSKTTLLDEFNKQIDFWGNCYRRIYNKLLIKKYGKNNRDKFNRYFKVFIEKKTEILKFSYGINSLYKKMSSEHQLGNHPNIAWLINEYKTQIINEKFSANSQIGKGRKIVDYFEIKHEWDLIDCIANLIALDKLEEEINQDGFLKNPFLQFHNNFDTVSPTVVYDYFHKELVETQNLSIDVLYEFLKQAFELQKAPKNQFKFQNLQKGKIHDVFYRYFKSVAKARHGEKKRYAALLGNYFSGFKTQNVMSNFSKWSPSIR